MINFTRNQAHKYDLDIDRNGHRIYAAHSDIVKALNEVGATLGEETKERVQPILGGGHQYTADVIVSGIKVGEMCHRGQWDAMVTLD